MPVPVRTLRREDLAHRTPALIAVLARLGVSRVIVKQEFSAVVPRVRKGATETVAAQVPVERAPTRHLWGLSSGGLRGRAQPVCSHVGHTQPVVLAIATVQHGRWRG
eukprot:scaffold229567_cov30-Tisochrysis_lutea.AAC.4